MVIDAADAWKLLVERERDANGAALPNSGSDLGPAAHQGHCFIDPQFGPGVRFKGSMLTPCQLSTIRQGNKTSGPTAITAACSG